MNGEEKLRLNRATLIYRQLPRRRFIEHRQNFRQGDAETPIHYKPKSAFVVMIYHQHNGTSKVGIPETNL